MRGVSEAPGTFSALDHDLRNPLTAILGFAELIREKNVDRSVDTAAGYITRAAHQVGLVADDLITRLELETTTLDLVTEPVSFSAAAEAAVERVRLGAATLEVERRWPADSPVVLADRRRLLNLISAALRAVMAQAEEGAPVVLSLIGSEGFATLVLTGDVTRPPQADDARLEIIRDLSAAQGGEFEVARVKGRLVLRISLPLA